MQRREPKPPATVPDEKPKKNSPGIAAGAEAVSFRRRKKIQVESSPQYGQRGGIQVPRLP
jgi:hypothetical protein